MARMIQPIRLVSLTNPPQVQFRPLFRTLSSLHGCRCASANHVEMSKSREIHRHFRTFCSSAELAAKKCVPCNSKDIRAMDEETAKEMAAVLTEWKLVNEGGKMKLSRSWKVKTFIKGLEFFQAIATVAEEQGHHPDLHLVGWNNVTVDIWTHSVGGITENDFILAAKIDKLKLADLLRIKPGN